MIWFICATLWIVYAYIETRPYNTFSDGAAFCIFVLAFILTIYCLGVDAYSLFAS